MALAGGMARAPGAVVLVTGGVGFVGSHVVEAVVARGDDVVVLDVVPPGPAVEVVGSRPEGARGRLEYVTGDVTDQRLVREVLTGHRATAVVHAAGLLGEPASRRHPRRFLEVNAEAVWDLCETLRTVSGVCRTVTLSSRSVYGAYRAEEGPVPEDAAPRPVAIYGASKAAADLVVGCYRGQFGVDVVAARITGPYGAGQRYLTAVGDMLVAVASGKPYRGAGADDCYETVYVKDTVRGILALLDAPVLAHPIYNVGNGRLDSLADIADAIRHVEPSAQIELRAGSTEAVPRAAMSVERIREELGFQPRWRLRDGLRDALASMRAGAGPGGATR